MFRERELESRHPTRAVICEFRAAWRSPVGCKNRAHAPPLFSARQSHSRYSLSPSPPAFAAPLWPSPTAARDSLLRIVTSLRLQKKLERPPSFHQPLAKHLPRVLSCISEFNRHLLCITHTISQHTSAILHQDLSATSPFLYLSVTALSSTILLRAFPVVSVTLVTLAAFLSPLATPPPFCATYRKLHVRLLHDNALYF